MSVNKNIIVFDTNILHMSFKNGADFRIFKLNCNFDNVISAIQERDIYEYFSVAISEITWEELKKQRIDFHNKKVEEIRETFKNFKFDNLFLEERESSDYDIEVDKQIKKFIEEFEINNQIKLITIPIVSQAKFFNIIERAINKTKPFNSNNKQSDKGFKDAVLWESILEYFDNNDTNLILYTKDSDFSGLEDEFTNRFENNKITIYSDYNSLINGINSITKNIDKFSYLPVDSTFSNLIEDWLYSDDFKNDIRCSDMIMSMTSGEYTYVDNNIVNIFSIKKCDSEIYFPTCLLLLELEIILLSSDEKISKIYKLSIEATFHSDDELGSISFNIESIVICEKCNHFNECFDSNNYQRRSAGCLIL